MKPKGIRIYDEYQEIEEHLLRLDADDRYLRFCHNLQDEGIKGYVERMDLRGPCNEAGFAIFDDTHKIIGFCHVAPSSEDCKLAEMAISVDKEHRYQGLGDILFTRGLLHCESVGATKIFMNCLASNKAIQKLARRNGMNVCTEYGEAVADLDVSDADAISAFLESAQNDVVGVYDTNLRYMTNQWSEYLVALNNIFFWRTK
jgi:GNAT superfamily N-acetyltransferase